MKERPIIFTDESVRAILAGTKTQTRRVIKPREAERLGLSMVGFAARIAPDVPYRSPVIPPGVCPFGVAGDRLWVKEALIRNEGRAYGVPSAHYAADDAPARGDGRAILPEPWRWAPRPNLAAMFMPRCLARILLDVTAVRVERLRAITEAGARAEGVPPVEGVSRGDVLSALGTDATPALRLDYLTPFAAVWDHLNAKRGYPWASDPWVWVLTLQRVEETS